MKCESRNVAAPAPLARGNIIALYVSLTTRDRCLGIYLSRHSTPLPQPTNHAFVAQEKARQEAPLFGRLSNANGNRYILFPRRRSLRNPSAADTANEVSFRRSLTFSVRGSGGCSKTKDASPGSIDRGAWRHMFRFGENKKRRGHQGTGRRRMPHSVLAEAARKEASSQWSSVPLEVCESPPG
ncbi:hypothetical protein HPB50_010894 [Hyalomma asiaticum]|uniref:Uncharacterized protein n=1 Tax=Hyalomma asiaticum TaxID=266040 RepID=A0ACB7TG82_HYAAI|nr:hypothetical protein HPB50_010894 [Hyalomma asiaticum]